MGTLTGGMERQAEGARTFTPREIGAFGAARRRAGGGLEVARVFDAGYFAGRREVGGSSGNQAAGPFHSPQAEARAAKPQGLDVGPVRAADPTSVVVLEADQGFDDEAVGSGAIPRARCPSQPCP